MKLTPWMLAVAAFLVVAALSIGFLFKKLFAAPEAPPPVSNRRNVAMAITDLSPGTVVQRSHLGLGPTDEELERDTVLGIDTLIGRIVKEPIKAATALRGSYFYPPGESPDLELAPGTRAVSVNVGDNTSMVDGLVKPGEYVDVFMTVQGSVLTDSGRNSNGPMTIQLFDGVKIIAINGSLQTSRVGRGNAVTLELDPFQAKLIVLAKGNSVISLTSNPDGPGSGGLSVNATKEDRVTLRELLGIEEEEEEEKPFVTEQYRGGRANESYYDKDGNRVGRGGTGNGSNNGFGGGTPLNGGGSGDFFSSTTDDPAPNDDQTAQVTSDPAGI